MSFDRAKRAPIRAPTFPLERRRLAWFGGAFPHSISVKEKFDKVVAHWNSGGKRYVVAPGREGPRTMPAGSADAQHAHYWRMLEAEARILASAMTDPEPKRVVLSIAEAYKRLTVRAALREPQPLIDNASFGPEALKVIGEAFDEAWTEIANN